MQSICPTCLLQVEHEEGVLEVECSCGAKFDPSKQLDDLPSIEEAMQNPPSRSPTPDSTPAPVSENEAGSGLSSEGPENGGFAAGEFADLGDAFSSLDAQPNEPRVGDLAFMESSQSEPDSDFSESTQAFDEIREFGESVLPGQQAATSSTATAESANVSPDETAKVSVAAVGPDGASPMRMTSGAVLQGFKITDYFTPLSLQCAVKEDAEEPLQPAFEKLWAKAEAMGGNGVIDLKWRLSADGTKVLISGTPVQCKKAE
ncbi:MAG: hypothetical protein KDD51_10850 [Bdellovibrionales bacterium]|nr:hypothetical protein [Bdellovibrionales bacterium]